MKSEATPDDERSRARRRLKVVFMGADNAPGGVAGYINAIVENLDADGFDFHAICAGVGGPRWLSNRITLHEFDGSYTPLNLFIRARRLRRTLESIKPDVIHLHTARAGLLGVLANSGRSTPVVYSGHTWRFEQKKNLLSRRVFRGIERLIASRSSVVTFLTRRDLDLGVVMRLVDADKCVAINTRIRDDLSASVPTSTASTRDESAHGGIVLNVGEAGERKNPMLFVEVARRVLSVRPHTRFEWLGDGPLRIRVDSAVSRMGLSHAIKFVGAKDKAGVRSRIAAARVFLFTSRYEGVPLAVLEAKLGGLPVVAGRYPGVEAVIRHGTDSFVFDLSDPDEGARHVLTLLGDADLHARFSVEGRTFATNEHSRPEIMAGEFADVYRRVSCGASRV